LSFLLAKMKIAKKSLRSKNCTALAFVLISFYFEICINSK